MYEVCDRVALTVLIVGSEFGMNFIVSTGGTTAPTVSRRTARLLVSRAGTAATLARAIIAQLLAVR